MAWLPTLGYCMNLLKMVVKATQRKMVLGALQRQVHHLQQQTRRQPALPVLIEDVLSGCNSEFQFSSQGDDSWSGKQSLPFTACHAIVLCVSCVRMFRRCPLRFVRSRSRSRPGRCTTTSTSMYVLYTYHAQNFTATRAVRRRQRTYTHTHTPPPCCSASAVRSPSS